MSYLVHRCLVCVGCWLDGWVFVWISEAVMGEGSRKTLDQEPDRVQYFCVFLCFCPALCSCLWLLIFLGGGRVFWLWQLTHTCCWSWNLVVHKYVGPQSLLLLDWCVAWGVRTKGQLLLKSLNGLGGYVHFSFLFFRFKELEFPCLPWSKYSSASPGCQSSVCYSPASLSAHNCLSAWMLGLPAPLGVQVICLPLACP